MEKRADHPCFSRTAHLKYARVHLPVAPRCNIHCNYCRRDFDCANESRPGVTSEVLSPRDAARLVDVAAAKVENLAVVGIAGPGDPLANPAETFETFRLVRERHPGLALCLSTNGLAVCDAIGDIVGSGVGHVTVTINAVDAEIGEKIYASIDTESGTLRGRGAARTLIGRQLAGLAALKRAGVAVKVNTILVPGINDAHILDLTKTVKALGAVLHNIVPVIPVRGTPFENLAPPTHRQRLEIQELCEPLLPQMRHCRQCRADAVGNLCDAGKLSDLLKPARRKNGEMKRIAVATNDGATVDAHFGHVRKFHIFEFDAGEVRLAEVRSLDDIFCKGPERCASVEESMEDIARALSDCHIVLCRRIGYYPSKCLADRGIRVEEGLGDIVSCIRRIAGA